MKHIGMAVIALFFATAHAEAAPACNGPGSSTARTLTFSPSDSDTVRGLAVSLLMGLTPASFPAPDIAKVQGACERAHFDAASASFTLYGNDTGLPPRWASAATGDRIAYVALLPQPGPALASYRANSGGTDFAFKPGDMMYVLAVTSGGSRQIYRFYDALPDDARLAGDMCAALNDQLPVLGTLDTATGQSDLARLGSVATPVVNAACHVSLAAGTQ
jgi:hypothetical protein